MSELTIYLRGVDLADLAQRYFSGEFSDVKEPIPLNKISSVQPLKEVRSTVSGVKSYEVEIAGHTVACFGYKVYDNTGIYANYVPEKGYNCMQCLRKIAGSPMGIPIRREDIGGKIHYHMIDIFCCFGCIREEISRRRYNTLYSNSMAYLGEIYQRVTGKDISELKPLSDRRFLKIFNGPKTWSEYHSDTVFYPGRPGNILFLPVLEYLEQEIPR